MAGRKRGAFFPDPEEMRKRYGENAVAAASVYGSTRPIAYAVMAFMGAIIVVITVLGAKQKSGFPGWAIALIGVDIAVTSILLTAVIMIRVKKLVSLRIKRQ